MGTTIAHTVATRNRPCALWCSDDGTVREIRERRRHPRHFPNSELPRELTATTALEEVIRGASVVIVTVPSPRFRGTASSLRSLLSADQVVLSATKGIELPTLKPMSVVLAEELGTDAVGAISGPNSTPDIMDGRLTAVVVAARDFRVTKACAQALQAPHLDVYANDDLVGVEAAGILKNTIAIALGIASGLGWAPNTRAFLFTRGLAEIQHLAVTLGARPSTFLGLAGVGDLLLTSSTPDSLNTRIGVELAGGRSLAEIVAALPEVPEGINSTRGSHELAKRAGVNMPIARRTLEIMEGVMSPDTLEDALHHHHCGMETDALC
jgi:glycerol-3-phosphate dehydrogenase (NAD(P)+)